MSVQGGQDRAGRRTDGQTRRRAGGQGGQDKADEAVTADMIEKTRKETGHSGPHRPPSRAVVWLGPAGPGGEAEGDRQGAGKSGGGPPGWVAGW